MQNFGENSTLIDHIYCCHLLNEKDGIYKRFGIDILLKAIQEYFLKEINSSKFLGDIKNNTQDFINYLDTLSDNIIENYAFLTYKQEEKKKKNNKNIMRLTDDRINEIMIDHLSLELNGNLSGKDFLKKEIDKQNIEYKVNQNIIDLEAEEDCLFGSYFSKIKNKLIKNMHFLKIYDFTCHKMSIFETSEDHYNGPQKICLHLFQRLATNFYNFLIESQIIQNSGWLAL